MTSVAADRIPPERELQLGWLDGLVRHRRIAYTLLALVYVISFNGIWRIGVDSALYRGLGRSLARGDGYVFAGEHHQHAYAGLPWMLAVLEKIFGDTPVPGIAAVVLMALATLWFVDRLIALRYPLWVATIVTLGLGLNFRFILLSQELMTDVPFVFGVMAALYGLERLRLIKPSPRGPVIGATALLLAGLAIAAFTRPTFGVLALAVVIGSFIRGVRNTDGRRALHFGLVAAAILVLAALFLTDPRTVGFSPMSGIYEQELVERVQSLPRTYLGQLDRFLGQNLNDSFFAQHMSPLGVPVALILLSGAWLVLRRDMVWGLMVVGIVLVTLPLSTVPRYYIMVMPMLWLGWVLLIAWMGLKTPAAWRGPVVFIVMLFPLVLNAGRALGFVIEQRKPDFAWLLHGQDRKTFFYAHYRGGVVPQQLLSAKMIADHAKPGQIVVGPVANILAYFSDRRVLGGRTLFGAKDVLASRLPIAIAKLKPDLAIFPSNQYGENDNQVGDLIKRRVLLPVDLIASAGKATLNTVAVHVPPPNVNWKTYRPPPEPTTTASGRKIAPKERSALMARRARKTSHDQLAIKRAKIQKRQKLEKRSALHGQAKHDRALKKQRQELKDRRERLKHRANPSSGPTTAPH